MPVKIGFENGKCYAQWGNQAKYYYECGNEEAKKAAVEKANKQSIAIRSSGYSENK